jgi:hypothetical protein
MPSTGQNLWRSSCSGCSPGREHASAGSLRYLHSIWLRLDRITIFGRAFLNTICNVSSMLHILVKKENDYRNVGNSNVQDDSSLKVLYEIISICSTVYVQCLKIIECLVKMVSRSGLAPTCTCTPNFK